jgi:soluble lytic murein transglycosylase
MKIRIGKKTAFLGLCLFLFASACAAPIASISPYDRDVEKVANLIAGETQDQNPLELFKLSRQILTLSRYYSLDPLLILAIIKVESGFKPTARSNVGAVGLMQVMPIVMREVGSEISVEKREELLDPYKNLHLGIYYFTYLLDKYRNNLQHALVAYNLGPSALDQHISHREAVSLDYYFKVMQWYKKFQKKMQTDPAVT